MQYKIVDNFNSKLQKAMGHSSLAVSLTYLRGLEVSELEERGQVARPNRFRVYPKY